MMEVDGQWGRLIALFNGKLVRAIVCAFLPVLLVSLPVDIAKADDGALAEALFLQGQALAGAGNYDEACPKFTESQRLDPSTGTLLNLAVCHEMQGRFATAWNEFSAAVVVARRDGRADRVAFAMEHITALEPKLSKLTIVLPEASAADGMEIQIDGTTVGQPALGVALPVDSGKHSIRATAPGKQSWTTHIVISGEGSASAVTIPTLENLPPSSPVRTPAPRNDPKDGGRDPGQQQRFVAYVLGGLGVIGLGVGTGFGIDALVQSGRSNKHGCAGNDCDSVGGSYREAARDSGDISTVAFIAGGTLLAAAVTMYLMAPSRNSTKKTAASWSASLEPIAAGGRLSLGGTW